MQHKKKLGRKVISYVLALVMTLSVLTGIAPGTGITAKAAETTVTTVDQLKEALEKTGGKVVLGADITVTDELAFNHETYLDLNGHVLTKTADDTIFNQIVMNNQVTISDSKGGGRFLIFGANNYIAPKSTTLILESGSLEAFDSEMGTINLYDGTFIMNGGIVSGPGAIMRGGNITINGGTVNGGFLDEEGDCNLTITGGKFDFDVSELVPEDTTVEKIGRHWYVGESAKDVEYDYIEPLNAGPAWDGNTGYYISKNGRRYYNKNEDGTYVEIKEGDWIISAPGTEVTDEAAFRDASKKGGKIKLGADITIVSNPDVEYGVGIGSSGTLDLNGHTLKISGLDVDVARVYTILDSKGGGKISFMGGEYGGLGIYGNNTNATVILESGTIEGSDTENAVITIEGGYYNARFIMNGGTVSGKKIFSFAGWDESVEIHDGTVIAVNGDFSGTEGNLSIKGGRFSFNPTEYIDAENYTVSEDGGYWVVKPVTRAVTIDNNITNGAVSVDKAVAAKEDTVNVTVTPAEGYELDTLTVTDADGQPVETEDNQFTMPGKAVTVSAVFIEKISNLEKAIQEAEKYMADNLSGTAYADVKKDVEAAIAAAKTLSEDATDEQVQEVIASLNQAQDTAKLNVAKIDAKAELDKLLSDENKAKYDDAEWEELKKAVEAGKKAIDEATSVTGVDTAATSTTTKTSEIKTIAVKQEEIKEVNDKLGNLPSADEVTTDNKEAIKAARDAYDALSEDQKKQVPKETLKKLEAAESAIKVIEVNEQLDKLPDSDKVTTDNKADVKAAVETARKAYEELTEEERAKVDKAELAKLEAAEVALVTVEISELPVADEVKTSDREAIKAAREAYEALSEDQKKQVSEETLKKLEAAESAIEVIEVNDLLSNLPAGNKVTTDNKAEVKAAVEAARKAYEDLTKEEKAKVDKTELAKLEEAEVALAIVEINDLPAADKVTADNKAAVEAAREAYKALSEDQKKQVSEETLKKLEAAEEALAKLEMAEVELVNDMLENLPASSEVTTGSKEVIEKARNAYDALTDDQKKNVDKDFLTKLEEAESALEVAEVNEMLNTLPATDDITTTDKTKIEEARAAYKALTYAQKKQISSETLEKLETAEVALVDNILGETAVSEVTTDNKEAVKASVEEARKAYDALNSAQKENVGKEVLAKLEEAESALKVLDVSEMLNTLPTGDEVTADNKEAVKASVEAARKAYDALTEEEQAKVDKAEIAKLEAAEVALAIVEINDLPETDKMTTDDKEAIEQARKAYEELSDALKEQIGADALAKLEAAEKALAKLEADKVELVNDMLGKLPVSGEVTIADKEAIEKARAEYEALSDEQKRQVAEETVKKLKDAESALEIAEVNDKLNKLPANDKVTTADKEAIEEARAAYEALSDEEKAQVNKETIQKLEAAEVALVADVINNLPISDKVTTADKEAIKEAKAVYEELSDAQKEKISSEVLQKLEAAEVALVADMLNALPDGDAVTNDDKAAIEEARKAYEALSDAQKEKIPEETLQKLDGTEAVLVGNMLNKLPISNKVTKSDKESIAEARAAYEALSDAQKEKISEKAVQKLEAAEVALVNEILDDMPTSGKVTIADKEEVEEARKAYDALTEEQKKGVDQKVLAKLEAAEAVIEEEETKAAINDLSSADKVSIEDKKAIEAARAAYDALTDEQRAKVGDEVLAKLEEAEAAVEAEETKATINDLSSADKVSIEDKKAIEAARAAYDALTDEQRAKVGAEALAKLEAAEQALKDLEKKVSEADEAKKKDEADTTVANKAADTINILPASDKVTTKDKAAIEAARKAYDALTDEQKAKVPAETLKKLEAAEKALAAAEANTTSSDDAAKKKDQADTTTANKASAAINTLPASSNVTTKDKATIEAARKAYNALTPDQKAKVPAETLKKLEAAEKALAAAELKEAKQEAQEAMDLELVVTQKGKKITLKWAKSSSAEGYDVYVQYCGKKASKPAAIITNNTTINTTITKLNGKNINLKKNFYAYIEAYKMINGKKVVIGKSNVGHIVGVKNSKYTNVKSIKLTKKAYTIKVGKTAKVKAKITLVDKNKKHIPKSHGAKFRYKSSDTSIATVDKNGKVKGIKKGTCTIYVYSINGLMKKVKVTVK